jgi:hypothetical protein
MAVSLAVAQEKVLAVSGRYRSPVRNRLLYRVDGRVHITRERNHERTQIFVYAVLFLMDRVWPPGNTGIRVFHTRLLQPAAKDETTIPVGPARIALSPG